MKIGIYCGSESPEAGGSSTLLRTIQYELAEKKSKHEFVFLFSDSKERRKKLTVDNQEYINTIRYTNLWKKIICRIANVFDFNCSKYYRYDLLASEENIDIFWFANPTYAETTIPYIYTVWDLGYRTTPYFPELQRDSEWEKRERMYARMVKKASFVLTGNKEGKREILNNFNIDERKIVISPFPISSFCYGNEQKPKFITDIPFFFYPAQFWPHKNHIRIIEAVRILKEKFGNTPQVIFTGSDHGNKGYIQKKIQEYGLSNDILLPGYVSDEELKYLYKHSIGMIFASLMGPNNLPPIEATFLNCPVIITDLEGHKEQLGDSALYFNGYSADELAERMQKLISDVNLRNNIIHREKELSKNFSKIKYCDSVFEIVEKYELIKRTWED